MAWQSVWILRFPVLEIWIRRAGCGSSTRYVELELRPWLRISDWLRCTIGGGHITEWLFRMSSANSWTSSSASDLLLAADSVHTQSQFFVLAEHNQLSQPDEFCWDRIHLALCYSMCAMAAEMPLFDSLTRLQCIVLCSTCAFSIGVNLLAQLIHQCEKER